MAAARFYSSTSGSMSISTDINAAATSMVVNSVVGLPGTTPFALVLDPGISASEEIVDVTNVSGTTLTITRAVDGTSAKSHTAGAEVRHMATARDFREPQEHIGASAAVHGLSGTVVGTTDVQTLTNKTAQAASSATKGLVVKGAASQTAAILETQDSTGTAIVSVKPAEGSLSVGSVQAKVNGDGASSLFGYVAKFTSDAVGSVVGIFKAAASQTADIVQIQNSAGTTLAKFDKDGKLTAPQVTSTGPVSGTTGTFSGAVSTGALSPASVASTGAVSGTTATFSGAASATTGTFSGAVTAPNLPASSATKAGKRLHWGTFSGTSAGDGFLTVTHGAGFTPTVVLALGTAAVYQYQADTFGGTTFRLRVTDASGAVGAYTVSGYFLAGE